MVFASLLFLYLFLPCNLILYFISKNKVYRNIVLVCFSMFFYAWGEPIWIVLLIFSATIDYFHGLIVEKYRGKIGAKLALISSLVLNLGLLATFKYSGFIVSNINGIFGFNFDVPSFALPIGISFYTFQTISYVIDVYKNEVKPQQSYMRFLLYVSMYHQLVAGPIVRYSHVAAEIDNRSISIHDVSDGLSRFIIGLSKKVIVANVAGEFAIQYMSGDLSKISMGGAWFGIIMFSLQIYFDFSGYSDMAIGLGRIFGFHYYENFNYPYISKSAGEFWRRWHISLGSFFRDYIYIPLGGNRKHYFFNIFVVWFATGLWHGASWNFILWGLYYGFLIVIENIFLKNILKKLPGFISHIYFLVIMLVGWVFFYFTDMNLVWKYMGIMFGLSENSAWNIELSIAILNNIFWIILALFFCMPVVQVFKKHFANLDIGKQKTLLYCQPILNTILLLICTSMLVGQSFNPFLYFRF